MPPTPQQPRTPQQQRPMPLETPANRLGLSQAQAQKLTPAAAKLTKSQLFLLAGGATEEVPHLTVVDLKSLSDAFGPRLIRAARAPAGKAGGGAACTCTHVACCCCCCAAAETTPIA